MILELLFNLIFDLVKFVLNLIPNFDDLFDFMATNFELFAFIEMIDASRFIVPWSTVFICIGAMFMFYNVRFAISILNWILKRIPTQS